MLLLVGLSVAEAPDVVDDETAPEEFGVRRWFLSFSSRRHFALRLENQTCMRASGNPILPANRSRAKTSG